MLLRPTKGEACGEGDDPFFTVAGLVTGGDSCSLLAVGGEGTERLLDRENFGEEVRVVLRDDLSEKMNKVRRHSSCTVKVRTMYNVLHI